MKFEKIKRTLGIEEADSDKDETSLVSGYAKLKGRCYGCGKFGHKSGDCPNKGDKKEQPETTVRKSGPSVDNIDYRRS